MVATTDQKARLLDLVTGVLELTRDGKRDAGEVANVLQIVKDDPKFAHRLLSPDGKPSAFLRDMRKKGWKLVEDIEGDESVPADQLELISLLRRNERYVTGEEMRRRAERTNSSLGQRQAEYLLEHQGAIPSMWYLYQLVFPGTVWRRRRGRLCVPCLYWEVGPDRWYLRFNWLDDDWGGLHRFVRLSK